MKHTFCEVSDILLIVDQIAIQLTPEAEMTDVIKRMKVFDLVTKNPEILDDIDKELFRIKSRNTAMLKKPQDEIMAINQIAINERRELIRKYAQKISL